MRFGAENNGIISITTTSLTPKIININQPLSRETVSSAIHAVTLPNYNITIEPPKSPLKRTVASPRINVSLAGALPGSIAASLSGAPSVSLNSSMASTISTASSIKLNTPRSGTAIENIVRILNQIDPNLLVPTKVGKHKAGYDLKQLREFAKELGYPTAGKNKERLIQDILAKRKEYGL